MVDRRSSDRTHVVRPDGGDGVGGRSGVGLVNALTRFGGDTIAAPAAFRELQSFWKCPGFLQ